MLPLEQQAGSQFLERVLRQKDEAFLLSFDVNVDVLQDLTNSPRLLAHALNKAEINTAGGNGAQAFPGSAAAPVPTTRSQGNGALRRHLSGLQREAEPGDRPQSDDPAHRRRRRGQPVTNQRCHRRGAKDNVIVYVILIADRGFYGSRHGLQRLLGREEDTEETGGRLIDVGNNGHKLEAAFQQIEDELRTQYVASYTPSNTKQDGTFRHITVECKGDGLKVQCARATTLRRREIRICTDRPLTACPANGTGRNCTGPFADGAGDMRAPASPSLPLV